MMALSLDTSRLTMSMSSRLVSRSTSSSVRSWMDPLREARGLRISWAMPAASSPTTARRSERRICSSIFLMRVRSWKEQITPEIRSVSSRRREKVMPRYCSRGRSLIQPSTR